MEAFLAVLTVLGAILAVLLVLGCLFWGIVALATYKTFKASRTTITNGLQYHERLGVRRGH